MVLNGKQEKKRAQKMWVSLPPERQEMVDAGFPLCYDGKHCSSCIAHFQDKKADKRL